MIIYDRFPDHTFVGGLSPRPPHRVPCPAAPWVALLTFAWALTALAWAFLRLSFPSANFSFCSPGHLYTIHYSCLRTVRARFAPPSVQPLCKSIGEMVRAPPARRHAMAQIHLLHNHHNLNTLQNKTKKSLGSYKASRAVRK